MHVLISGGGIAGPALAWWLAKAGIRSTVLEKAATLLTDGQNIDIDGTARQVIRRMGLEGEVRRLNTTEEGCRVIGRKGEIAALFPVKKGLATSGTSELEILRGDLAKILFEAAKNDPLTEFMFDTTITEVISNDDTSVRVKLSNGETREFDILVAADGQRSPTRRKCFPDDTVTIRDMNVVAVYGTIPRQATDENWWDIYQALGRRTVSTRPDPHGTIRAMFTCMPRDGEHRRKWHAMGRADRAAQQAFLRTEFADAGWQTQRIMDAFDHSEDYYFHIIEQVKMSPWSQNRVVCVGDAGYAPSPLSGGGTPLAILGAYILAGEVSKLDAKEHPGRAFAEYERVYRGHVEKIQNVPAAAPRLVHPQGRTHRWIFRTVMKLLALAFSVTWFAKLFKEPEEDFKLPHYAVFDDVRLAEKDGRSVSSESDTDQK